MDRRRMMMAAQTPPTPSIQPYFRLAFTNGLTPEIAPAGTTISKVGTVSVITGEAIASQGELQISPNPFVAGEKSYRFKYKQTTLHNYTRLYMDCNRNSPYGNGFYISVGSVSGYQYVDQIVNNAGNFVATLPTQVANTVYDLVFTTTGDTTPNGCKLYVNGVLTDTQTAPAASSSASGAYGYLMDATNNSTTRFDGSVYLMEIYDRVLTADEVLELYNS